MKTISKTKIIIGLIFGLVFLFWGQNEVLAKAPVIKTDFISIDNFSHAQKNNFLLQTNKVNFSLKLDKGRNGLYQKEKILLSQIYKARFTFNGIGLTWFEAVPEGTKLEIYLRILEEKNWTGWMKVASPEDQPDFAEELLGPDQHYSDLIFTENGKFFQYKIILETENSKVTPQVKKIEFIYFDSTTPPQGAKNFKIASSTQDELKIISRQDWGADESWRYCQWWDKEADRCGQSSTQVKWPLKYTPVEKIIIHHTAGSQGDGDFAATVRGVYWWHAIVRGWGDLGYNYLIDKNGNIYEGRYGGDGAVGGHAYGYNEGSLGLALLGTYGAWSDEDYKGAYQEKHPGEIVREEREEKKWTKKGEETYWRAYVDNKISLEAQEALNKLIASKARDFEFTPQGIGSFYDKVNLPNIAGHKDVGQTTCPGDNLYVDLELVRTSSQNKFVQFGGLENIVWKATKVGQSDQNFTLKEGEISFAWVEFRNDGNITWHSYDKNPVKLLPSQIKSKLASLDSFQLALASSSSAISGYEMSKPNIPPGETVRFTFTISGAKTKLEETKDFVLALGDRGWFSGTDISFTVVATNLDYATRLAKEDFPRRLFDEESYTVTMQFENTGAKSWSQKEIRLKIFDKNQKNHLSLFRDESWSSSSGSFAPEEKEIAPGELATFVFKIKGPAPQVYNQGFYLVRNITPEGFPEIILGQEKIAGSSFELETQVDSAYQAEFLGHSLGPAMLNIWRPMVKMEFMNTGGVVWDENLTLESQSSEGSPSQFQDKSWPREAVVERLKGQVQPEERVTFIFRLKAPAEPGLYRQIFKLRLGERELYINGKKDLTILTRVDEG